MSWITGLADKAENILNKIDQNAATALQLPPNEAGPPLAVAVSLDAMKRSLSNSTQSLKMMTLSPAKSSRRASGSETGLIDTVESPRWLIGDSFGSIAIDMNNEPTCEANNSPAMPLGVAQMSASTISTDVNQELAAFKIALNEVTNERDELRLRLSASNRDVENAGLKQHAIELESFVQRLTEERDQAQLELHDAQSTGNSYAHSISELETNLAKMQQEYVEVAHKLQMQMCETEQQHQELQSYRTKAHRALQLKDNLIAELKSSGGHGQRDDEDATRLLQLEYDALKQEHRHGLEENGNLLHQLKQVRDELSAVQQQYPEQLNALRSSEEQMRKELRRERERCLATESEQRVLAQELETMRQQLSNQMAAAATRLQEKEQQLQKLRVQQGNNWSNELHDGSPFAMGDYAARLKTLTQTLVDKQHTVEKLTAERNALRIQMEKLQDQLQQAIYANSMHASSAGRCKILSNSTDDVKAQYPLLMKANPFDNRVARRVKRAYSSLDSAGIRLGAFLRRYPLMRIFVLMYVALLHIWVVFVLLSTSPN